MCKSKFFCGENVKHREGINEVQNKLINHPALWMIRRLIFFKFINSVHVYKKEWLVYILEKSVNATLEIN